MTYFFECTVTLQSLLLVISQLTVITLMGGSILMFLRKCRAIKQMTMILLLIMNVILYVLMQLDNRTGKEAQTHLLVPYGVLLLVILLSCTQGILTLLNETKNRKTINNTSIKESFNNLPTGVCFFNETGLPVLCNPAMQRFSFNICGKDVQFITDMEKFEKKDYIPVGDVKKEGDVFVLADGTAWQLEKRVIKYDAGEVYAQYIAKDVTLLYKNREELLQENEQLRKVQSELKKLSANVVAVTREEEILNTKMRVHDEMGRCLLAAQKYLKEGSQESIPDTVAYTWQRAVSTLKYNNDTPDEDMLSQIRKTCESVKIAFIQNGELPKEERVAYLLTCALRECVTNAVRYADAKELYADFEENEQQAMITVTNSGRPPEKEIVEGGGLSTLRYRVERAGGKMTIESKPRFKLTVTIPKLKESMM